MIESKRKPTRMTEEQRKRFAELGSKQSGPFSPLKHNWDERQEYRELCELRDVEETRADCVKVLRHVRNWKEIGSYNDIVKATGLYLERVVRAMIRYELIERPNRKPHQRLLLIRKIKR